MIIRIIIPGNPIAKKRPRFFHRGNFVGTYNDQKTEEGRWLFEAQKQVNLEELLLGAISLQIDFCMPITKGWSLKKQRELRDGQRFWHTKKPDLDNLVKFVKDCLNGIVWKDDSQIAYIETRKYYSLQPQTMIIISGLK